jgi:hypothetical protein
MTPNDGSLVVSKPSMGKAIDFEGGVVEMHEK